MRLIHFLLGPQCGARPYIIADLAMEDFMSVRPLPVRMPT